MNSETSSTTTVQKVIFGVIGIGIIVVFGLLFKFLGGMKEPPKRKADAQKVRVIKTTTVKNENVNSSIMLTGKLIPLKKVELFAEVSGILYDSGKEFKEGTHYSKGQILLSMDRKEAEMNLLAQKSSLLTQITQMMADIKLDYPERFGEWSKYVNEFSLEKPLKPFPKPVTEQEKFFLNNRNIYNPFYAINGAEARLAKYVVRAPFTGVLTMANINPGALVRAGQNLGVLSSTYVYELEGSVSLSDLEFVKKGDRVTLTSPDISGEWEGKIKRISDVIDAGTQTIKVFVAVKGEKLREGMFLSGTIAFNPVENVFEIDRNYLVEEQMVYVVEDSLLALTPVQVVKKVGKTALIRGLDDGTVIMDETTTGKSDGMQVKSIN